MAGKLSIVNATLRAHSNEVNIRTSNDNDRFLSNAVPNAATTSSSSSSEALPPFGPKILNGYQSCDELKVDVVKVLTESGKNSIQSQKDTYCGYYNDTFFNNSITFSNRRTKQETSYGTNNQVPNVEEKELLQSDGTFLYLGTGDRILVSDLNGKVVANVTVPYPPATTVNQSTWLTLDSIFINNNNLTALATIISCDEITCSTLSTAFFYNFDLKTKSLNLIRQYNVSNAGYTADARNIGPYTYIFSSFYFGDLFWPLYRCNENFTNMSAAEYETAALDYLSSNVDNYANKVVDTLSNDGATASCNNFIKIFNGIVSNYSADISFTKVSCIGLDGMSSNTLGSTVHFIPYGLSFGYVFHVTKNSMLVAQTDQSGSFLIKFAVNGSTLTPNSVGTVDGVIPSQYNIDLFKGYYRIASTSILSLDAQVHVLQEKNSQLQIVGKLVNNGIGYLDSARFSNDKGFISTTIWDSVKNEYSTKLSVLNLKTPTNPKIAAAQDLFTTSYSYNYNIQPIENGEFVLVYFINAFYYANATAFTVQLFQVAEKSLKQVGKPSEVVIREKDSYLYSTYSDAFWDPHALRYLPKSHKLILPVTSYYFVDTFYYNTSVSMAETPGNIQTFLVYDVDLSKGAKYIGNVTHDSEYSACNFYYPPRSMVFNGDLVTSMGSSLKRTSTVSTLNGKKWELKICN